MIHHCKKHALILAAGIVVPWIAWAQPTPGIAWQRSMGSVDYDTGFSIVFTSDGGYLVAGMVQENYGDVIGYHGGESDAWVVKLDENGNIQWSKALGGSGTDMARSACMANDGGYVVVGSTNSMDGDVNGGHGGQDIWVVKLDATGNLIWQEPLGGSDDDWGNDVDPTEDGGYLVAGNTRSVDGNVAGLQGGVDAWVVKINGSADLQWQRCLGGSGYDSAASIRQTSDGGYILAGQTSSEDGDVTGLHGNIDAWVVKMDAAGSILWQKPLGGSSNEYGNTVEQTADGGFLVAADALSNDGDVGGNHGSFDLWVVKLDTAGSLQWQGCFGGSEQDYAMSVKPVENGGCIVAGRVESQDGQVSGYHGGDYDGWLVRLEAAGILLWEKAIGGSNDDRLFDVAVTGNSGYIVTGSSSSNDGDVSGNHGESDVWVVKLGPDPLDVPEFSLAPRLALGPNPATQWVDLQFALPAAGPLRVDLLDVHGKVLRTVLEQTLPAGGSVVRLPLGTLPAGVYLVRLTSSAGTITQRLVKPE